MGRIAARYAKALLEFSNEAGVADKVYSQVGRFVDMYPEFSGLLSALENPSIALNDKLKLVNIALGGSPVGELNEFVRFLGKQKRLDHVVWIFAAFLDLYRESQNIHLAVLTTPNQLDKDTETLFLSKIKGVYSGSIELVQKINPDLIGGYVLEIEGRRWDGSIRGMLQEVRKQLTANG